MNEHPLISICMPCYNGALFIEETFFSFIKQTYKNFEIIVVDDGSTDNSLKIINDFSEKDQRIKVISQKKNKGAAAARNLAFKNSKGDFIVFFDSDDLVNEGYLEAQIKLAKANPESVIACKLLKFFNGDLTSTEENLLTVKENLRPIDWLLNDNAKGLNLTQCGMFFIPRHLVDKAGLWDEKLSLIDDFEFFPRLLLSAKTIVYNNLSIVYYRQSTSTSLSLSAGKKVLTSAFNATMATSKLLLKREYSQRTKNALASYWRGWIYHAYSSDKELYQIGTAYYQELTGKAYKPQNSGITGIIDFLIGWKLTKKIKNLVAKF